jgi:hypothetical protein
METFTNEVPMSVHVSISIADNGTMISDEIYMYFIHFFFAKYENGETVIYLSANIIYTYCTAQVFTSCYQKEIFKCRLFLGGIVAREEFPIHLHEERGLQLSTAADKVNFQVRK